MNLRQITLTAIKIVLLWIVISYLAQNIIHGYWAIDWAVFDMGVFLSLFFGVLIGVFDDWVQRMPKNIEDADEVEEDAYCYFCRHKFAPDESPVHVVDQGTYSKDGKNFYKRYVYMCDSCYSLYKD